MRTSTFILSSEQKWIFAVVLTLAVLFAGCSESPTSQINPDPPKTVPNSIEGGWTEIYLKGQKGNGALRLHNRLGIYEALSSDGSVEVSMRFEYELVSTNILRIKMMEHVVNGQTQQSSGANQDVLYSLHGNMLRIFDRDFIRSGNRVDGFF